MSEHRPQRHDLSAAIRQLDMVARRPHDLVKQSIAVDWVRPRIGISEKVT